MRFKLFFQLILVLILLLTQLIKVYSDTDRKTGRTDKVNICQTDFDFLILTPFSWMLNADNQMIREGNNLSALNATAAGNYKMSKKLRIGLFSGYFTPWKINKDGKDKAVQYFPLLAFLTSSPTDTIDVVFGAGLYNVSFRNKSEITKSKKYGLLYGLNFNIPVSPTVYIPIFFHFHMANALSCYSNSERFWIIMQFGTGVKFGFD